MPIYIRDDTVDDLVKQMMRSTGTKTKTDVIRQALEYALANHGRSSLLERIKPLQARVESLGPADPDFDMKFFTDELWGDDTAGSRY